MLKACRICRRSLPARNFSKPITKDEIVGNKPTNKPKDRARHSRVLALTQSIGWSIRIQIKISKHTMSKILKPILLVNMVHKKFKIKLIANKTRPILHSEKTCLNSLKTTKTAEYQRRVQLKVFERTEEFNRRKIGSKILYRQMT